MLQGQNIKQSLTPQLCVKSNLPFSLCLWLQWNPSNANTIETATVCPEYGGVRISEAFGIFPVAVAMCTWAVEDY